MLHVLLLILKITGIVIACILGLVIIVVAAVLFVPVRYKADADYHGKFKAHAKLSWLGILRVLVSYDEELAIKAKALFITIYSNNQKKEKTSKHRTSKKKKTKHVQITNYYDDELKTKIDTVVEKKLPTFKTLMEKEPVAVAQTMVNGAKLTAYENGYAVYEVDGSHTVMAVDRCNDYRYDFTDGTYEVIPAETFEDVEWSVRLLMEGERRMEHNLNKRVADSENVSLECDGSDWSVAVMVDFLDEDNAEMLADRELRRLYAVMSKLTERQTEVIQLYFYKGMTLQEIAEELGITKPAVHYAMKGALKKMRKSF